MKKLKFILCDRTKTNPVIAVFVDHEVAMIAYREYVRRLDDARDLAYIDVLPEMYEEKE